MSDAFGVERPDLVSKSRVIQRALVQGGAMKGALLKYNQATAPGGSGASAGLKRKADFAQAKLGLRKMGGGPHHPYRAGYAKDVKENGSGPGKLKSSKGKVLP